MAQATTFRFSKFLILVGDGSTPEDFAAPCGLTSRGFNRTKETNDTNVPDCADEDAPSWLERDVVSLSAALSGSGVLAEESVDIWDEWFESTASRNVRITLGEGSSMRTWQGAAHLSTFNIQGERGSRVTAEIEIVSDGEFTRVS